LAKTAVEAIADRDVHQTIFAAQRYRRFGALLSQREKAGAGTAAHHDCEGRILERFWVHMFD
jgi:hypothetical protein